MLHGRGAARGGGAALRALLRGARRRAASRSRAASSARTMLVELVNDGPVTIVLMRLLVTGGAGYLGSELCAQAVARGCRRARDAVPHAGAARPRRAPRRPRRRRCATRLPAATARTSSSTRRTCRRDAPTIVPRRAPRVAAAAHRAGARLVHLSTDLVFDGEQGAPYDEDAEPRPVSAYGAAKLEAERLVARAHPEALLVRTSLLYGKPGPQEALAAAATASSSSPTRSAARPRVAELAAALLELARARRERAAARRRAPRPSRGYELGRLLRAAARAATRTDPRRAERRAGRARNVALDSSRAAGLLERGSRGTRLRGE